MFWPAVETELIGMDTTEGVAVLAGTWDTTLLGVGEELLNGCAFAVTVMYVAWDSGGVGDGVLVLPSTMGSSSLPVLWISTVWMCLVTVSC